jgi:hypothetical protein
MRHILVISLLSFFLISCATKEVYKNYDPNEYVRIDSTSITEAELIKNDIAYYKKTLVHSSKGETQALYIEKSSAEKFRDYSIRAFATPVTVVVDAAVGVVVVGIILIIGSDPREAIDDKYRYQ